MSENSSNEIKIVDFENDFIAKLNLAAFLPQAPESEEIRNQCYEAQIMPNFEVGHVLMYRLDTWHRGTPVKKGKVPVCRKVLWVIPIGIFLIFDSK